MKLEVNGKFKELTMARVLAVIPSGMTVPDKRGYGINVSLEFDREEDFDREMTKIISSSGSYIHGYIIGENFRIPIDIHDGNIGECYFGYVNPTLFD